MSDTRILSRPYVIGAVDVSFVVPPSSGAPAGYVGPGDLYTFANWWGLRAYNNAKASANAVVAQFTHASDSYATPHNVTVSSCGVLATSSDAWFDGSQMRVFTLYDQAGSNNFTCLSGAVVQVSTAKIGTGAPGRIDYLDISNYLGNTAVSQAQPFTISTVVNQGNVINGFFFGCGSVFAFFQNATPANMRMTANNQTTTYVSSISFALGSTWAANLCFNGASSIMNISGTPIAPGDVGASTGITNASTTTYGASVGPGGDFEGGGMTTEIGVLSGGNTTTLAALSSNQQAFWGI